ncbi:MAG: subunit beta of ring hydroxylating [Rhodospirillales bacterium]|jgi:p-cumate 2,3-dioxygenase beta subunit|nr:subunit beta of ring hydroxylating [Rhodospirillales bacterium]
MTIARAEVEDFLYREAALLDEWRLDDWIELLTADCIYRVPPNDKPDGAAANTLYIISDDMDRIKARIVRLKSRNAHAEYPHSRTRRLITNVRIVEQDEVNATIAANFVIYRFRREEKIREYVGTYNFKLTKIGGDLKIAERIVRLDAMELASLGSVSFIL